MMSDSASILPADPDSGRLSTIDCMKDNKKDILREDRDRDAVADKKTDNAGLRRGAVNTTKMQSRNNDMHDPEQNPEENSEQHQEQDREQERADVHPARPWIVLTTTYDVEAWIDNYNRDLQQAVKKDNTKGYGICFCLELGGEVYMHTTSEGDILLDVTEEAVWVAPVITAATGVATPASSVWALPGDTLTQLVLGLSGLIAATRVVVSHAYKTPKSWPQRY